MIVTIELKRGIPISITYTAVSRTTSANLLLSIALKYLRLLELFFTRMS